MIKGDIIYGEFGNMTQTPSFPPRNEDEQIFDIFNTSLIVPLLRTVASSRGIGVNTGNHDGNLSVAVESWFNGTFNSSDMGNETNLTDTAAICVAVWNVHNVLLMVCFTLIFCLSVVGNCVVIVTISQQRNMRTVTNIFLLNLAVADLLVSVICMPLTLLGKLVQCFLFANWACKLMAYLQPVAVTASSYTLAVIAFERFFAIVRPLHSRYFQTASHALKMIVSVWTSALLVNAAWLLIFEVRLVAGRRPNCTYKAGVSNRLLKWFQVYVTFSLLIIPLAIMIGLYWRVIISLRSGMQHCDRGRVRKLATRSHQPTENPDSGSPIDKRVAALRQNLDSVITSLKQRHRSRFSRSISEEVGPLTHNGGCSNDDDGTPARQSSRQSEESVLSKPSAVTLQPNRASSAIVAGKSIGLRSTHMEKSFLAKKRVIRMLIAVVVLFTVCWMPLYLYALVIRMHGINMYNANLHAVLQVLGYASSCTNPITYCFLNKKFRNAFKASFGCKRRGASSATLQTNLFHQNQQPHQRSVSEQQQRLVPQRHMLAPMAASSAKSVTAKLSSREALPPVAEVSRELSTSTAASAVAAVSTAVVGPRLNSPKETAKLLTNNADGRSKRQRWTAALAAPMAVDSADSSDDIIDLDDVESIDGVGEEYLQMQDSNAPPKKESMV